MLHIYLYLCLYRFDLSVDEGQNFRHKTVLAMPIKYSNSPGRVIGVFQLVNKFDNLPFTSNDENFLEAFAIFCGMGISNVKMYETACTAMAKQQVALEVLSYHAIAPLDEAVKLSRYFFSFSKLESKTAKLKFDLQAKSSECGYAATTFIPV